MTPCFAICLPARPTGSCRRCRRWTIGKVPASLNAHLGLSVRWSTSSLSEGEAPKLFGLLTPVPGAARIFFISRCRIIGGRPGDVGQLPGCDWPALAILRRMATIRTIDELEALYDVPVPTSVTKEIDHLTELHSAYVAASPFVLIATSGPAGLDCSPRGDPAGFVRVRDERTLLLPDRRGNNRLDSLRNLVVDPRIGLLFLVPGVNVTLRVNGPPRLSTDIEFASRSGRWQAADDRHHRDHHRCAVSKALIDPTGVPTCSIELS